MTDEQLIAARVAGLMGRAGIRGLSQEVWPSLAEPAEVLLLMCKFGLWPKEGFTTRHSEKFGGVLVPCICVESSVTRYFAIHDNTPESRQQAVTRAVLLAVEQILKEKQA